jgi:uncharacterized protein (DUF58 family)
VIRLHGDPAGSTLWIVSRRGIILALAILAFAVWNEAGPLAAAAAALLALAITARGWSALALGSVTCSLEFHDDRAFPDDEVDLILTVKSRGPIPVPWLEIDVTVPRGLYVVADGGMGVMAGDGRAVHLLATLMPLRSINRTLRVRCRQRGRYEVPTVSVLVADPLRLFPRRTGFLVSAELLIYPRIVPLEQVGLRAGLPVGDLKTFAPVLPDPSRPLGVRDYRPGDSPRMMHWKASARRGTLQVKVLERTVRRDLALYLDVGSFDHSWLVYREALFERAVTAAASLAQFAIDRGGSVSMTYGGANPVVIPGNSGLDQLRLILENLAVVQPAVGRPLESMLAATLWRQPAGSTIVLLTPAPSEEALVELEPIRQRGYPIAVVYCGLGDREPLDGVAWFDVGRDRDIAGALAQERRP